MFQTKITSQGTISLPAVLRKKYGLKPGEVITIEDNGQITILKTPEFKSLRAKNREFVKPGSIQSGAGFSSHVAEKYGKN